MFERLKKAVDTLSKAHGAVDNFFHRPVPSLLVGAGIAVGLGGGTITMIEKFDPTPSPLTPSSLVDSSFARASIRKDPLVDLSTPAKEADFDRTRQLIIRNAALLLASKSSVDDSQ